MKEIDAEKCTRYPFLPVEQKMIYEAVEIITELDHMAETVRIIVANLKIQMQKKGIELKNIDELLERVQRTHENMFALQKVGGDVEEEIIGSRQGHSPRLNYLCDRFYSKDYCLEGIAVGYAIEQKKKEIIQKAWANKEFSSITNGGQYGTTDKV